MILKKTLKSIICLLLAGSVMFIGSASENNITVPTDISTVENSSPHQDEPVSSETTSAEEPQQEPQEPAEPQAEPEYYYLDVGTNHKSWNSLLAANSEVAGWIDIPGILKGDGYPVVLKNDSEEGNSYYLHRALNGSYDSRGTIFMDFRCVVEQDEPLSQNMTLYGHHQKNGEMFGFLRKYKEIEYIKKAPIIQFDTIYEPANYLIFSVFITNTLPQHGKYFEYRDPEFKTQEDFLNFIEQCRRRSLYDMPVDVQAGDTIITLSTCTYEFDDWRLVVMGRKLREGEESKVHVSEIKKNSKILYPDIWYKRYGGEKPVYDD